MSLSGANAFNTIFDEDSRSTARQLTLIIEDILADVIAGALQGLQLDHPEVFFQTLESIFK